MTDTSDEVRDLVFDAARDLDLAIKRCQRLRQQRGDITHEQLLVAIEQTQCALHNLERASGLAPYVCPRCKIKIDPKGTHQCGDCGRTV